MVINEKALRENTLGVASAMLNKATSENREFSSEEQTRFDALVDAFQVASGIKVPKDVVAFQRYIDKESGEGFSFGDSHAGEFGPGHIGTGGKSPQNRNHQPLCFVDSSGRAIRALAPHESMADFLGHTRKPGGVSIGNVIHSMATGNWDQLPSEYAAGMSGGDAESAGYMVGSELSPQITDLARARSVLVAGGARTIPMTGGELHLVDLTQDPTAHWRHETVGVPASNMKFGRVTMLPGPWRQSSRFRWSWPKTRGTSSRRSKVHWARHLAWLSMSPA